MECTQPAKKAAKHMDCTVLDAVSVLSNSGLGPRCWIMLLCSLNLNQ